MKALALILCLFSLAACGRKNSDNKPETDRWTQCGDENEKCLPDSIIEIVSSHLPEKVKVTFAFENDRFELMNECEENGAEYEVTRGPVNTISILTMGTAAEFEAQVIITDLGANCDQDVIFYDELVTSEVVQINGTKPRMVFNINN